MSNLFYLLGFVAFIVFGAMVYSFIQVKSPFTIEKSDDFESSNPKWKKDEAIVNANRKYIALSLKLFVGFLSIIGVLFFIVYQIECVDLSPEQCFKKL